MVQIGWFEAYSKSCEAYARRVPFQNFFDLSENLSFLKSGLSDKGDSTLNLPPLDSFYKTL